MSTIYGQLVFGLCLLFALTTRETTDAWAPRHVGASKSKRPISIVSSRQHSPDCVSSRPTSSSPSTSTQLYGLFDFLTNPYDSKIPPELQDEIYRAEANTEMAKDRGTRIVLYTLLAILGIGMAVFNGFLTELRINGLPEADSSVDVVAAMNPLNTNNNPGNTLDVLNQAGFGWVVSNPLYKFLFTNKIGGALCLLMGGGSALLAEAEFDSKRINAEKIYEELERRREQKSKGGTATAASKQRKKKKQSGKQKKSLKALSEVIVATEEEPSPETPLPAAESSPKVQEASNDKDGIFGKVKDLYDKADSMAASQALLLNKKLEDAGVVDKITDETGLKVIGKEEAAKQQQQKQQAGDE